MQNITVACVQPRMTVHTTADEFTAEARRFLRQAQAKAVQLTIFPELTGVLLAPPLISRFKLGFVKRQDRGRQPNSGFLARSLGRLAGTTASALGGGFRGSLERLLRKKSDEYLALYQETLGQLAAKYSTAIVGGSFYILDPETGTIRNRAYVFDVDGTVLGYQDKLNLTPDEQELAAPGNELTVFDTRYGRLGVLIGRDALYPELARLLALQGADLIAGIAAIPGVAYAHVVRNALALRAEENQVYAAASFLIGPNHLGREDRDDYYGRSALLAPIALTPQADGVLVQAGTNRTEGFIAATLDGAALESLQQSGAFRPRSEMHLGGMGPLLAELYEEGLTIEEAASRYAPAIAPLPEEEEAAFAPLPVAEDLPDSIPEALALGEEPEPPEEEPPAEEG